jgi:hypothetical protein
MKVLMLCLFALSSFSLRAGSISFTGSLATGDDVFTTTLNIPSVSDLTIQTWGYAGGTDAAGQTIVEGGFDPAVALFAGGGSGATLFDFNDDGTCPPGNFDSVSGACLDSSLSEIGLLPGTYTLVLMVSPNSPNGPTLADGFTGGGDFVDVFGNLRASNFAVDAVITADAAVPEPGSIGLLGVGCLGLIADRLLANRQQSGC